MAMMSIPESTPDQRVRLASTLSGAVALVLVGLMGFTLTAPHSVAIPASRVHSAAMILRAAHILLRAGEKRVLEAFPNADIIIHPDPRGANIPHGGVFASGPAKGHA